MTPSVNWVHIDLAGPAMASKSKEWLCEGGTGFGAQLLLEYFQHETKTIVAMKNLKNIDNTPLSPIRPETMKEAMEQIKKTEQE